MSVRFFVSSVLLGVGLAMDAFSVSLANGLHEPEMAHRKMCGIALVFALFQAAMPMIGWLCVHSIVQCFSAFEKAIPWIALGLLVYIGVSMIAESTGEAEQTPAVGLKSLLVQGVATSIDALSVGFTIAEYTLPYAVLAAAIIALVTFFICYAGVYLGKKAGTKLAGKAGILGGIILIFVGLEIFLTSVF
ncbi:MAG: manganese efflux pump [Oscillospiraceae bacterium]|nr:manganese efflux pump [Oscillospiraceae bacterium]